MPAAAILHTDRAVRRPGVLRWAGAVVLTCVLPLPIGLAMALAARQIEPLIGFPDDPQQITAVGYAGLMIAFSSMYAWIGMVPGAMAFRWAHWAGYGGVLTAFGLGVLFGVVLMLPFGPFAVLFGLPYALAFWWIYRALSDAAAFAPPANDAPQAG